jgi:hypothetical protein
VPNPSKVATLGLSGALSKIAGQADEIENTYIPKPLGGKDAMRLTAPAEPGKVRPFNPGEYVTNPDASWSSERTMTVRSPHIAGGKWTVIPSVWIKDGKPYEAASEAEAIKLAKESGLRFKGYPSLREADQSSIDRESKWQTLARPEDAASIEPLWETHAAGR